MDHEPFDATDAPDELTQLLEDAERKLSLGATEQAARALEAAGAVALDEPEPGPKRRLAALLAGLGDQRLADGAPPAAIESYRAALSLMAAVVEASPEPSLAREHAFLRYRLGAAELAAGRREQALERFEAGALEIEALLDAAPDHPGFTRDLSASRSMLGDALTELGQRRRALEAYGSALELAEAVDGAAARAAPAQLYMATLHRRIAAHREALGEAGPAVHHLQRQAAILEGFRRLGAAEPELLKELIEAYRRLAALSPAEAKGALAAALEIAEGMPPPGDPALSATLRRALAAL